MRAKDCPECGDSIYMWTNYKGLSNRAPVKRLAKRMIRQKKRDHGNVKYHMWVWDFKSNVWVKGCARKNLIHNGGK